MRRVGFLGARGPRGAALRVALAAIASTTAPGPALAAFELRDASPAALGAVSTDLAAEQPMFADPPASHLCVRMSASHASLYQTDGLSADRVQLCAEGRPGSISISYARVGVPGAGESSLRFAMRESEANSIALELGVERLDLALDGEEREGGWAFGAAARARVSLSRVGLEIGIGADRLLRDGGLDRLAATSSLPVSIRLRAGGAAASWVDRWEGDGRRSPRFVLDLPIAGVASIRLGRGESPGRVGAAVAVRLRRVEVSAGRLDLSSGGVVTGAALGLVPSADAGGR